jgi:dimeric dUTPase (all-alpha-NTP-PPase superfamily)
MNTKLEQHGPYNPFEGKSFKIMTYNQVDQVINSEVVEITSQEQFNTVLENIKQFNNAQSLGSFLKKYKKLITE